VELRIESLGAKAGQAEELLAAMANRKRLLILCELFDGEKSVSELAGRLRLRPSTVSQHLTLLRKDRLVTKRREAQSFFYSLAGAEARVILEALYGLYCSPKVRTGRQRPGRKGV